MIDSFWRFEWGAIAQDQAVRPILRVGVRRGCSRPDHARLFLGSVEGVCDGHQKPLQERPREPGGSEKTGQYLGCQRSGKRRRGHASVARAKCVRQTCLHLKVRGDPCSDGRACAAFLIDTKTKKDEKITAKRIYGWKVIRRAFERIADHKVCVHPALRAAHSLAPSLSSPSRPRRRPRPDGDGLCSGFRQSTRRRRRSKRTRWGSGRRRSPLTRFSSTQWRRCVLVSCLRLQLGSLRQRLGCLFNGCDRASVGCDVLIAVHQNVPRPEGEAAGAVHGSGCGWLREAGLRGVQSAHAQGESARRAGSTHQTVGCFCVCIEHDAQLDACVRH